MPRQGAELRTVSGNVARSGNGGEHERAALCAEESWCEFLTEGNTAAGFNCILERGRESRA
jgi:hypothetical protein